MHALRFFCLNEILIWTAAVTLIGAAYWPIQLGAAQQQTGKQQTGKQQNGKQQTESSQKSGGAGNRRSGRGPSLVKLQPIVQRASSTTQTFVGTLYPLRRSVIGSAVDGRVDAVMVAEGESVRSAEDRGETREAEPGGDHVQEKPLGQPLVQIKTQTLDIEIESAQIQLELLQQALAELELSLPREIALAKAAEQRAKAEFDYAESQFERYQNLATGGGVSQREREEANSLFLVARQALAGAEEELRRLETTRELRLKIAQSRLAAQESELKRLDDLKNKYTLRAPYNGAVVRKLVEQGDWVTRGAPVVEVIQLDVLELKVNVPQEYLAGIQQSLDASSAEAPLVANVAIDDMPRSFEGQVMRIVPEADPRTRTIPVVIRVENPETRNGYLLTPGLLARAQIKLGLGRQALFVDKDALVLGERQIKVFVAKDPAAQQTTVREVVVQLGTALGDQVEVIGDLSAGEQVVVLGNERLRDQQEVRVAR